MARMTRIKDVNDSVNDHEKQTKNKLAVPSASLLHTSGIHFLLHSELLSLPLKLS